MVLLAVDFEVEVACVEQSHEIVPFPTVTHDVLADEADDGALALTRAVGVLELDSDVLEFEGDEGAAEVRAIAVARTLAK